MTTSESGQPANAPLQTVVCHPDAEIAWTEIAGKFPPQRQLKIVSNPFLSDAGTWFAFSVPSVYPTIVRVLTDGSDDSAVSFSGPSPAAWHTRNGRTSKLHEQPGTALDATHTVGYQAVSGVGVAKLTTT